MKEYKHEQNQRLEKWSRHIQEW